MNSDSDDKVQDLIEDLATIGFSLRPDDSLRLEIDGYPLVVRLSRSSPPESTIDWGAKITVHHAASSSFRQAETLVVLECVAYLLKKGYQPGALELERTWRLGHGGSGRLDVLIKAPDGTPYAMIECKTWGSEYQRERSKMLDSGGQLLTYFNQDRKARGLYLYASRLPKDGIQRATDFIRTPELKGSSVEELYSSWDKTLEPGGLFHEHSGTYDDTYRGLYPRDLLELDKESGAGVFNSFAEILRRHVISDKSNAFNKIFNLFLCKIADEGITPEDEEVAFQWKYGDTFESFIQRVTDLYRQGMSDYLNVDLDTRFYSPGLDFAFVDVFDQASFEQNAVVVKEVVELLQPFRLMYSSRHQYLGDFFEMLLNTGVKQESGQFFTPVPLVEGILRSLPIADIIRRRIDNREPNILPYVIDFACGAGHFLTQAIDQISSIAETIDRSALAAQQMTRLDAGAPGRTWASEYVYGIERDYRLAKVTKVATFLNGDGLANVIQADGLGAFDSEPSYRKLLHSRNPTEAINSFDVVVSNPPFSVNGFLNGVDRPNDRFKLAKLLTPDSGEIECLFLERTSQLLMEGGVAGLIFPISLLSSNVAIYAAARRLLALDYIVAGVWELRERTFIATSTTTICLHLRKRTTHEREEAVNALVKMSSVVKERLEEEAIDVSIVVERIQNLETNRTLIDAAYDDDILAQAMRVLMDFSRVSCVAFSGASSSAEQAFLGYRFSQRRGREGLHYITDPDGRLVTRLYSDEPDSCLVSDLVQSAFLEEAIDVPEELAPYATMVASSALWDASSSRLLNPSSFFADFSKVESVNPEGDWIDDLDCEMSTIGSLEDSYSMSIVRGLTYDKKAESPNETAWSILTASSIDKDEHVVLSDGFRYLYAEPDNAEGKRPRKGDLIVCASSGSLQHLGKIAVAHEDLDAFAGGFLMILRPADTFTRVVLEQNLLSKRFRRFVAGLKEQNISNLTRAKLRAFQLVVPTDSDALVDMAASKATTT